MSATPSLAEVVSDAIAAARGGVNVSMPATVLTYDPARQVASVKPSISMRYLDASGVLSPMSIGVVSNLPVLFPSGGGFSLTWDLVPGDQVLLVVCDRSLDEWKLTGAQENVPVDIRRFDFTDSVVVPSIRPITQPLAPDAWATGAAVLKSSDVRLGSSLAADFVALSSKVDAALAAIVNAFNAHTHMLGNTPTLVPSSLLPPAAPTGATSVKAI
ncbi:MAG: hypothetical protein HOP09_14690 [Hyphomicrobium sp.]|nr:hypothetical protein [Hyphomicrobium sp.]